MIVVRSPLMNRPIWVAEESRETQLFIQRSLLDNLCRDDASFKQTQNLVTLSPPSNQSQVPPFFGNWRLAG
jgi:hypothetical protein